MRSVDLVRDRAADAHAVAAVAAEQPAADAQAVPSSEHWRSRQWQFGGFVDVGYLFDVNDPANKPFRSRGTTWHLDEPISTWPGAYVERKPSDQSRVGRGAAGPRRQRRRDLCVFGDRAESGGPRVAAPHRPGEYLVSGAGGQGFTIQGGIFTSLIGYDSLYAKDNFNYTRPWGADFTPYLMMGVNASYPLTDKLTGTLYVVNGYWHLANANRVPSTGAQMAYKATPQVTMKETVLWGPHQANTAAEFWRYLSDTIVERRTERVVAALNAISSTETSTAPARPARGGWPRSCRSAGRFTPHGRCHSARDCVGLRGPLDARRTDREGHHQHRRVPTSLSGGFCTSRVQHRFDDSSGPGGGFSDGDQTRPSAAGLKRRQQLLILALILTLDSRF